MKLIKLIFILILLLTFYKFNAGYEKKYNNKFILQEKNVKKTLDDFTFIDTISKFANDLFIFS